MSVCALVGGQFGSEGKGLIAGHIARDYEAHVRVGAANAGHTLYTLDVGHEYRELPDSGDTDGTFVRREKWEKHVMQQIPCAAYANPDADLYVGPGALISPEIFKREREQLIAWRRGRGLDDPKILVDYRAHVITDEHIEHESQSGLERLIGSTSTTAREGIGSAQAARVMRGGLMNCVLAEDYFDAAIDDDIVIVDAPWSLNLQHKSGRGILLEGTQGTGLSLVTGPFPYTTSRNTTAAGLCADSGVAPNLVDRCILVCRTYPIRVAGNSGPFHRDSAEISWDHIGIDPENERTTVTKKIRRVATFSIQQVMEAAWLNGATEIAITFADYLDPDIAGSHGDYSAKDLAWHKRVYDFVQKVENATHLPVTYIGTGPRTVISMPAAQEQEAAA